ncbi:hypothetical protein [Oceanobacillus sp. CFH 90083]|nr:hypothetical protein [Oceanobacillus sp. CFH 90083]
MLKVRNEVAAIKTFVKLLTGKGKTHFVNLILQVVRIAEENVY